MREKILWITAALTFCLAYVAISIFPLTQQHSDKRLQWIVNTGVLVTFVGIIVLPLASLTALFLPKRLTYMVRFIRILPFFIIVAGIFTIYLVVTRY